MDLWVKITILGLTGIKLKDLNLRLEPTIFGTTVSEEVPKALRSTLRSRTTNPLWGVKDFVMRFVSLWMTFFGLSKGYLVTMIGHGHRRLFRYNT